MEVRIQQYQNHFARPKLRTGLCSTPQMSRQQLIDISEKAFNWASSHSKDPAQLSLCVAEDVAWLTPLPGTTPDFAGILAYQQTNTSGSSDFKMTLRNVIVDEIESRVVHFMEITGTHDGYHPHNTSHVILVSGWAFQRRGSHFMFTDSLLTRYRNPKFLRMKAKYTCIDRSCKRLDR